MSFAMTVTRLALRPREHAETLDIVDDRVHEEGALRPRVIPLRVHVGGVHAPAQELLVEQDAVGELHSRSTQPGCLDNQRATVVQCFSIVWHLSSVFVIIHALKTIYRKSKLPEIKLAGDNLVQLPGFLRRRNCT